MIPINNFNKKFLTKQSLSKKVITLNILINENILTKDFGRGLTNGISSKNKIC